MVTAGDACHSGGVRITDDDRAKWAKWDAEYGRDEGPFDIDEVDLTADDVQRFDLGSLIVTPYRRLGISLADVNSGEATSLVVTSADSALRVRVLAGPSRTSILAETREEYIAAATRGGGTVAVSKGPFGAELVVRSIGQNADGKPVAQLTRTWLVEGPGWLLHGILLGKAAAEPKNPNVAVELVEFFANLVVRRDDQPAGPGTPLGLRVPAEIDGKAAS